MSDLEKQLRQMSPRPLEADFIGRVERALEKTETAATSHGTASTPPRLATPQRGVVNYSFSDRCLLSALSLAAMAAGVIVVCVLQDVMVAPARSESIAVSSPPTPTLLYYQRTLARSSLGLAQDPGF